MDKGKGFKGELWRKNRRRKHRRLTIPAWVLVFTLLMPKFIPATIYAEGTAGNGQPAISSNEQYTADENQSAGDEGSKPEAVPEPSDSEENKDAPKEETGESPSDEQETKAPEEKDKQENEKVHESSEDGEQETDSRETSSGEEKETYESIAEERDSGEEQSPDKENTDKEETAESETDPAESEILDKDSSVDKGTASDAKRDKDKEDKVLPEDKPDQKDKADTEWPAADGICQHHPKHTEECGYIPAGRTFLCSHVHDEECGYWEEEDFEEKEESEEAREPEETEESDEAAESDGTEGTEETEEFGEAQETVESEETGETEESKEIKENTSKVSLRLKKRASKSSCNHVHDDTCGYIENGEGHPCEFRCPYCINDWQWGDEEEILVWSEEEKQWGLGLPGASEEFIVTRELLTEMIPREIHADTAAGIENVGIQWDFSAFPEEGAYEGSYTFTAVPISLMEGEEYEYVLTKTAPKMEILVELGGGELYVYPVPALAINEWTWEGFGVQGEQAFVAVNIDGITTAAELVERLKPLLPKRIYGSTLGDKENKDTQTVYYTYDKKGTFTDPEDGKEKTKSWGYLEIDWTGADKKRVVQGANDPPTDKSPDSLETQIESIFGSGNISISTEETFCVIAGKPVWANVRYYINDGWNTDNIYRLPITIKPISLEAHTVPPANPENVTVNLFDYWVKTKNPTTETKGDILDKSDKHYHEEGGGIGEDGKDIIGEVPESATPTGYSGKDDWNQGINKNHLLLFGDGMIHAGLWNKGAGENCRYGRKYAGMEGIVKNVLPKSGYPEINLDMASKKLIGDETKRDHTLIKDYKLTGDHVDQEKQDSNGNNLGYTYDSSSIQNLSETVIETWNGDINSETKSESLQYLFDPNMAHSFKTSYSDVTGLFQLDENGYYYYNMRKNFAEFSQEDGNHFILYDAPATTRTDHSTNKSSYGNFFPFNKGSEVFNGIEEVNGKEKLTSSVDCSGNTMNHHLGMTVDVDFRQPAGGKINTAGNQSQPMTFQFSGDDDVWVFIDDVLVLDMGGIHSEVYGIIDFATGDVLVGRGYNAQGIPSYTSGKPDETQDRVTLTNLKELYEKAGKADITAWNDNNSNTFASGTSHTLRMFYLERGNYDSSIALRFNLQPLLYQQIKKVDQNGDPVKDVKFALYPAVTMNASDPDAIQCLYTDSDVEGGNTFYVKQDTSKGDAPLIELTTGEDGSAQFRQPDANYFNFADRGDEYYILKEISTPEGYRSQPVDIVLHYDSVTTMLSVANRWTTGAYACSVSNIMGTPGLKYGVFHDDTITAGTDSVPQDVQSGGLAVAIPLLEKKSNNSWLALYGSNLTGFRSVPMESGSEEAWRQAILEAVLKQAESGVADWYLNWDSDNSRLRGLLSDLPGLAGRYRLYNSEGDMQMVYGLISPEALTKAGVTGKDAGERYKALAQKLKGDTDVLKTILETDNGFRFLSVTQFNRDFRSLIYIPNEQRELRVQKIEQDGRPVPGTEFGLYDNIDCSGNPVASGVTDSEGMLIFSPTRTNGTPGQAQMVWASSTNTQYYLKEIAAPPGYSLNPTVVPIVVGIYSIYADAGTADDGISVMAGAGRLTQTMRQYAMGGDVDITLQDITVFMQTQESTKTGNTFQLRGWRDVKLEGSNVARSMNLHFGKNAVVDYGLHDEDGGKIYKPFFVTDTGFVRTRIQQNYPALMGEQYEGARTDVNKDNLKDLDLTNLFSMLNIVVVKDRTNADTNTGQLTIGKKVTGNHLPDEDYTKNFTFTVQLSKADGTPLEGSYQYYFYGEDKVGYLSNGEKMVLHHDESVTVMGLPAGTRFTVKETPEEGWFVRPGAGVYIGAISKDGTFEAVFTNSRDPEAPDDPYYPNNPGSDDDSGSSHSPGREHPAGAAEPAVTAEPVGPGGLESYRDPEDEKLQALPAVGDNNDTFWHMLISGLLFLGVMADAILQRQKRRDGRR